MFLEQLILIGLLTGAVYSLVGVGFTIVLGVGKVANFAHGSFVTVGLYVALFGYDQFRLNAYEVVVPAGVFFVLLGIAVAELFEWRGRKVGEIGELLVGLALLLVIGGGIEVIYKDQPRQINDLTAGHIHVAGFIIDGTELIAAIFTLALAILTYVFLRKSRWGRALRAVAVNSEAAGLYGIRVPVAQRAAIVASIVIAGVAGVLISPFTVLTPDAGTTYLISAFAVVIVGGIGNTVGAVFAGLGIGLVNSLSAGYLNSYWTSLAPLIVILVALLARPEEGAFA